MAPEPVRPGSAVRDGPAAPLFQMLGHTTVVLVLFTVAYYLLPFNVDRENPWTVPQLVVALLALALLGIVLRVQVRRSQQQLSDRYQRIQWLLSALYGLVLVSALVYAFVADRDPGQFVGISDRTDALYFSVTVVSTVGFGDIHASGNLARLLVTAHMVFNLVYLGTALRVLTSSPPPLVDDDPA